MFDKELLEVQIKRFHKDIRGIIRTTVMQELIEDSVGQRDQLVDRFSMKKFFFDIGRKYVMFDDLKCDVFIPFTGEIDNLSFHPSITARTVDILPPIAQIETAEEISIPILLQGLTSEQLSQKIEQQVEDLLQFEEWLNEDIQAYNKNLIGFIDTLIDDRVNKASVNEDVINDLNVPIKRRKNQPAELPQRGRGRP